MEIMEYKEDQYYNTKQNTKDKERFERKQAWKKFKSLKQQLVDKHLEEPACSTESEIKNNSKPTTHASIYETERFNSIPLASITKICLKANDDSSLIRNIVKKKGETMMCSQTLSRLENLAAFEFKHLLRYADNFSEHSTIRKLKYKQEYYSLFAEKAVRNCRECKKLQNPSKERYLSYSNWWKGRVWRETLVHWLQHKDTELAEIYSADGINGIIELDEKRVGDFIKHIKAVLM